MLTKQNGRILGRFGLDFGRPLGRFLESKRVEKLGDNFGSFNKGGLKALSEFSLDQGWNENLFTGGGGADLDISIRIYVPIYVDRTTKAKHRGFNTFLGPWLGELLSFFLFRF